MEWRHTHRYLIKSPQPQNTTKCARQHLWRAWGGDAVWLLIVWWRTGLALTTTESGHAATNKAVIRVLTRAAILTRIGCTFVDIRFAQHTLKAGSADTTESILVIDA